MTRLLTLLTALIFLPASLATAAEQSTIPSGPPAVEATKDETVAVDRTPEAVLDIFHEGLLDILKRSEELGYMGRVTTLGPIIQDAMNVKALGARAVGRLVWNDWSPEQRSIFIAQYADYMSAQYADRFDEYNNQQFVITGSKDGPKGSKIVSTEVIRSNGDITKIDYLFISYQGQWGIADIWLDSAVSEVAMRRAEFSSILRDSGYEGLLTALADKIQERAGQSVIQ